MGDLLREFLKKIGASPDAKPMTIGIDQRDEFYGLMLGAISEVLRRGIEARDVNPVSLDLAMELAG